MSDVPEYDDPLDFEDEPFITSWHKQDNPLSPEQVIQMNTDFQQILETPAGERVLKKIMSDLYFFQRCETPEEVVLNNYAKKLWSYLGDWDVGSEDSIVSKLLNR